MRNELQLNRYDLIMLVGTRAMLGAGIGLLVSGRLSNETRRAVGRTLLAIGAATTVPLAMRIFGSHSHRELAPAGV
jgi:hypothetical protein